MNSVMSIEEPSVLLPVTDGSPAEGTNNKPLQYQAPVQGALFGTSNEKSPILGFGFQQNSEQAPEFPFQGKNQEQPTGFGSSIEKLPVFGFPQSYQFQPSQSNGFVTSNEETLPVFGFQKILDPLKQGTTQQKSFMNGPCNENSQFCGFGPNMFCEFPNQNYNNFQYQLPTQQQQLGENVFSFGQSENTRRAANFRVQTPGCDSKPPCAVIATFYQSSSYDDLFRSVPQMSPDPENLSIAVFSFNYEIVLEIFTCLQQPADSRTSRIEIVQELLDCMQQVSSESIVFNFECCSNCSDNGLGVDSASIIPLVHLLLQQGSVAVFGDFSLKGLIHDWREDLLGPNPFVRLGQCNHSLTLRFNPEELISCSNSQLQTVGRLCDTGLASLHALSGTIVYTTKPVTTDLYELKLLTVVTDSSEGQMSARYPNDVVSIGEYAGTAGHVELKYATGGLLITSAGHWIELSRINTSEESVINTLTMQMGSAFSAQAQCEMQSSSTALEREVVVQKYAMFAVQSSAPCTYSKQR